MGKTLGVLGATWLVQRFTRARLAEGLSWRDMFRACWPGSGSLSRCSSGSRRSASAVSGTNTARPVQPETPGGAGTAGPEPYRA